ncbi:FKBP-type peptidyl-prolyl cis-trans isomerase [Sedimenticola selenatireducens]|uniref:Peptidyl-prolyl cis-trans isomerase n=1 Tax=Sedimenticola selenatireducens TaxID=191960 RepID=A0A557SLQ0_9GAMM|nr:FKBP-type peptidyl-prolyl cis-trans isomerase [Sedimenticola selenatireducens]TVO78356.1 FKBP-type peptidyl-prolyl cis-trans isomerase [Sedimenticola selenatireducens]TVT62786.1 MAG: FKBP-type peptidyl-prolyl cis-trans isomerase [Sedimenticola selenatireducens]
MFVSIKYAIPAAALTIAAFSLQAEDLATLQQRFSYALGQQFAQQLKQQGVNVDGVAFGAAVDDALKGNPSKMTPEQMGEAFRLTKEAMAKEKAEAAIAAQQASEKYLEQNSKQAGVVVLPSGLQYQVIQPGEGAPPPADAEVTVHYRGTLISGEEFDSSYARNEPATFSLNGVIPGFSEGLGMMNKGAKWKLFIPSKLGYGEVGAPGAIGPNETLIFEVELISITPAKALEEKKGE